MTRPNPTQLELIRGLLALEGAAGGADDCSTAATRVFDKLRARLVPILGAAGVQALLDRSAKLTQRDFPFLEPSVVGDETKLNAWLRAQDPAVAMESATFLFGTFLTLIGNFIGERLLTQLIRIAWPTLGATTPGEPIL